METDVRPNLGEDGTLVIRARGGEARGYPDGGVFAWKACPTQRRRWVSGGSERRNRTAVGRGARLS